MSKHRGEHHEEHVDESWLIPYADLLTLLLALFIVMFASSSVDKEKMDAVADSFHVALGTASGGESILEGNDSINPIEGLDNAPAIPTPEPTTGVETSEEIQDMKAVEGALQKYFEELGVETEVHMKIDDRGLVISLKDSILFESGNADIMADNAAKLSEIGKAINQLENFIHIEGHTDNMPISNANFNSNRELSFARALSVLKVFEAQSGIHPQKMVPIGYAEYKPVADNSTAEGRSKNRRVDIIILDSKFNSLEVQVENIPTVNK